MAPFRADTPPSGASSQQRQARLDASTLNTEVVALPTVTAITQADDTAPTGFEAGHPSPIGDDDNIDELDIDDPDAALTDEEFYADALGMLP